MTGSPQRRHEGGSHWTGFLLLIVPVKGVGFDVTELFRRVEQCIEGDVTLDDCVRVGMSDAICVNDDQDASVVRQSLARWALDDGHMFAPQAVFGCVLVGNDPEQAAEAATRLGESVGLKELPIYYYPVPARGEGEDSTDVVEVDKQGGGRAEAVGSAVAREIGQGTRSEVAGVPAERPLLEPDPAMVEEVMGIARVMIESFERWPDFVIGEERLIAHLRRPVSPVTAGPDGVRSLTPAVSAPRLQQQLGNVARRVRPPTSVQAQALDRLARSTRTITLVYLILVQDRHRIARSTHRRRQEVVIELDLALAERGDLEVSSIETALFTAGRRLRRYGPLRTAGTLDRRQLPKISAEYWDLMTCVDELLEEHRREAASLGRRGIAVSGIHAIFLSTAAPLADAASTERLDQLSQLARVTWVLLDVGRELMSEEYVKFDVLVLHEHPDVTNELVAAAFGGAEDPAGPEH